MVIECMSYIPYCQIEERNTDTFISSTIYRIMVAFLLSFQWKDGLQLRKIISKIFVPDSWYVPLLPPEILIHLIILHDSSHILLTKFDAFD